MDWYGIIYQDATGYFLAFEEGKFPQRGRAKRVRVFKGELQEIMPEMERQVERLNWENRIWHGAVFRDNEGYFAAFQRRERPSRPGAEFIFDCEGDLVEIMIRIENLLENLNSEERRENVRRLKRKE